MVKDFPNHYENLVALMGQLGTKIPATMEGFGSLHKASTKGSSLTAKAKKLKEKNSE